MRETQEPIKSGDGEPLYMAALAEQRRVVTQWVALITQTPIDDVPSDAWLVRLLCDYPQITPEKIQELLLKRDWRTGDELGAEGIPTI